MSKKKFIVSLPDEERQELVSYINTGTHSARSINRARILLLADQALSDPHIAKQVGVCEGTVFRIRRRYATEGMQAALTEKPRPGAPRKFTGRDEANLTLLACTDPPTGYQRWTHRLLADKLVELNDVPGISYRTVGRVLKKMTSNPGKSANGASDKSIAAF